MKYRLLLAYDGTDFSGWQIQPRARTVQGEVQCALSTLLRAPAAVTGCGRTDAGVHARSYPAHFTCPEALRETAFLRSLNAILPPDISASSLEKAADDFHARYSAAERSYEYRISRYKNALERNRTWVHHGPLDTDRMRKCLELFPGTHDFSRFCIRGQTRDTLCTVLSCDIREIGSEIRVNISANRFLHKMVRMIVGTLAEAGRGKTTHDTVRAMLAGTETRKGATAPPHGLCFTGARYTETISR